MSTGDIVFAAFCLLVVCRLLSQLDLGNETRRLIIDEDREKKRQREDAAAAPRREKRGREVEIEEAEEPRGRSTTRRRELSPSRSERTVKSAAPSQPDPPVGTF